MSYFECCKGFKLLVALLYIIQNMSFLIDTFQNFPGISDPLRAADQKYLESFEM